MDEITNGNTKQLGYYTRDAPTRLLLVGIAAKNFLLSL